MSRTRRKRIHKVQYQEIELNIMPFIDVFSLLNTFLLFSAVFISLGIVQVQVPFLSNAAPPPDSKTRSLSVKVDISKQKVEVSTSYSMPPADNKSWTFENTVAGVAEMHNRLVSIRKDNVDLDLATVYSEDDVNYEELVRVLDSVKLRKKDDPIIRKTSAGDDLKDRGFDDFLFPKVVMGSVML